MLTYGITISQPNDPLLRTDIETVVKKIRFPKPEFSARIEQLRQIRILDEKQYSRLKIQLPYFCCGIFHPPFRRKENFAAIHCLTLDFDHFSNENISKEEAFERIKTDDHVRLLFTTPGGDGLKALFLLDEPCMDAGMYSHFYKAYAHTFAKKYSLEKVTDWVTHDVTRASFFSADPGAWDKPGAKPVRLEDYVQAETSIHFTEIEKEFAALAKENTGAVLSKENIPGETLNLIKSRLNPNYRPKREKNVFIPEQLNDVLPLIQEALEKEMIRVAEIRPINYGKQLKVQMEKYWAEMNIFYGKKGFSIVRTTKTGSNHELGELAFQIIDNLLN